MMWASFGRAPPASTRSSAATSIPSGSSSTIAHVRAAVSQRQERAVVRRPLDDDRVARLHQRVEQERVRLHRAVGDDHLLGRDLVALGDPRAQRHVADRGPVRGHAARVVGERRGRRPRASPRRRRCRATARRGRTRSFGGEDYRPGCFVIVADRSRLARSTADSHARRRATRRTRPAGRSRPGAEQRDRDLGDLRRACGRRARPCSRAPRPWPRRCPSSRRRSRRRGPSSCRRGGEAGDVGDDRLGHVARR